MDQPIPEWLDADFMTQCLRHEKSKQNIVVTNVDRALAVAAGNNFGSCVVRVKLEYKNNKDDDKQRLLSLIVKSEVTEGPLKDAGPDLGQNFTVKEPTFYKRFLPEVKKITNTDFAPKSLFSPKFEVTVLEDLKEQQFLMVDRTKPLDFEHCRLYMEAAAAFHASSFVVHKHKPDLIESLGIQVDFSKAEYFLVMVKCGLQCFAESAGKIEQFKKYQKLIESVTDTLWDMVMEVQKPCDSINTLTQGDPWSTNMMFKYDTNGAVCEVKLLDFQALLYTSPVNDVIFFLWTSASHEVRRNRSHDLYRIYIERFNRKLEELKCTERLTYDSFMDNVKRLSPVPFYIVGSTLPFFVDPNPVDIGLFRQKDAQIVNPFQKYYNGSFIQSALPKYLEQLELAGVFEYMEQHYKTG